MTIFHIWNRGKTRFLIFMGLSKYRFVSFLIQMCQKDTKCNESITIILYSKNRNTKTPYVLA